MRGHLARISVAGLVLVLAATGFAIARPGRLRGVSGVAGKRYCEILLVRHRPTGLVAEVFNTFTLNDCPPARWRKLNTTAVARATGAILAVRNGPRYWLMDRIEKLAPTHEVRRTLGGIPMIEQATVPLTGLSTAPYTVHRVNRFTVFAWSRGRTVFELHGPGGTRWIMQSYSRQVDATLTAAELPRLARRLTLPAGWSYHVRRLTAPLRVVTVRRAAEVTQDSLDNTYSRLS